MTDIQEPGAETSGATAPGSRIGLFLLIAGIVALGVLGSVSAVIVVIALLVMIFMHELGHYLTAKSAGMKVTEFFLGFGPRIWSFHKGETEYGLKAIPAGAYVRIIGMHNLDPVAPEDEPRAYKNQPYWRKMSVASAGSMMHFIMAVVLLFCLFAFYGQQQNSVWTVGSLSRLGDTQTSPAIAAGLKVGDKIVSVDGIPVSDFDHAVELIQARPGQTIAIEYSARWADVRDDRDARGPQPRGQAGRLPRRRRALPVRAPGRALRGTRRGHDVPRADVGVDQGARIVLLAERTVALCRHVARQASVQRGLLGVEQRQRSAVAG